MFITMGNTLDNVNRPAARRGALSLVIAIGLALGSGAAWSQTFGFGSEATAEEIAAIDIDVMPDGFGAPPGEGTYQKGKEVYMAKCAACHGQDMTSPVKGTGAAALAGGRDTLDSGSPKKTVESYWPYASTLFDYTKRAMPFNAPGSMTDEEVYAVVAYILAEGGIIDQDTPMNAETIGEVKMPNWDGFVPDPRPDVYNYR